MIIKIIKKLFKIHYINIFKLGLKFKLIILPDHYYIPIANILELQKKKSWRKKSKLKGINFNIKKQIKNLYNIIYPEKKDYMDGRIYYEAQREGYGQGFGKIEAQALYAVTKNLKPNKIFEIGSGSSTYCMLKAGAKDITCIEPFPSRLLKNQKKIKLIKKNVQDVDVKKFQSLNENDILLIDSTHTLKIGSDVSYIYLEILPQLKKGVIVMIHDIFFPYNYQRDADKSMYQWMETQILQAFLINNPKVEILFCLSYLHYLKSNILKKIFPLYKPQKDKNGIAKSMLGSPKNEGDFPSLFCFKIIK
jgi:predicted O-methyltransferase YrrM